MNTGKRIESRFSQGYALLAVLFVASSIGVKPAQAGTEEALAGIVLGAILISAAQESHAEPPHYSQPTRYREVHYREESHREGHYRDNHRGQHWEHGAPSQQIGATHRPTQRGSAHHYRERYTRDDHRKARNYHKGKHDKGKHHKRRGHQEYGREHRKHRYDRYSHNGHRRY